MITRMNALVQINDPESNSSLVKYFVDPYAITRANRGSVLTEHFVSHRIATVMISRFMLNLQSANRGSSGMVSSNCTHVDSVVFERVVGSLAGSIDTRYGPGRDLWDVQNEAHSSTEGGDLEGQARPTSSDGEKRKTPLSP